MMRENRTLDIERTEWKNKLQYYLYTGMNSFSYEIRRHTVLAAMLAPATSANE